MVCHKHPRHMLPVTTVTFSDWAGKPCPLCETENLERMSCGKRALGAGFLRPKVLLYGEDCPDEEDILKEFQRDLRGPVDAVVIVGTRLQIPCLQAFVLQLCKQVNRRKGIVAWLNKEGPALNLSSQFGVQVIGDCDSFASSITG